MELTEARAVAEEVVAALAEACERIEVAGSIRRGKADPKDVEIVYIPKVGVRVVSFFRDEERYSLVDGVLRELMAAGVLAWDPEVKRRGEKYKRFVHCESGLVVELFAATAENWGLILAIRTGPGDFNKVLVSKPWHGGAMPLDMKMEGGYLWHAGKRLVTETEAVFFEAIGVPCWPPAERTVGRLVAWMAGR